MIKVNKHPCDFKRKVSHIISDTTGSGENYIDTYYLCTMTGRRLKKRECVKCKRVINIKNHEPIQP
jgi:hypothetical protein